MQQPTNGIITRYSDKGEDIGDIGYRLKPLPLVHHLEKNFSRDFTSLHRTSCLRQGRFSSQ